MCSYFIDGDGVITAKELKLVMHSLGQPVTGTDIEEMIKEADTNCSNSISEYHSQVSIALYILILADGKVDFKGKCRI